MSFYSDDERYGVGDAQQFFGAVAPWADPWQSLYPTSQPLPAGGGDIDALLSRYVSDPSLVPPGVDINDPANYPRSESNPAGYDPSASYNQPLPTGLGRVGSFLKNMGGKALNFAQTPQGIMTLLAAIAGAADRRKKEGGGTGMGMPAPRQYTRTLTPGAYGPIARYAANGGLMQAYAQGGEAQAYAGGRPLMMEDGGFVFTQKATEELGPRGIAALGGKMISAPGNGTDDKGITGIIGKHGVTPARVSHGESYFSEEAVERNGGPKRMYAAMNKLQRKA